MLTVPYVYNDRVWWFEREWPRRLLCLNTLSPLGRTVWEGLGRCGFVGGGVTLEMVSEISKDCKIFTILFFLSDSGLWNKMF